MQKIIFLQGLPASGKSSLAKQYCGADPDLIRINKDSIRNMLFPLGYSPELEHLVIDCERAIGIYLLNRGSSIIVDDCNFNPKHLEYWQKIASDRSIELHVVTLDTPVDVCISRDLERQKSVGIRVILDMYLKYVHSNNLENK